MFLNNKREYTNLIENFLEGLDDKCKVFNGKESQISVYMFFGNYRLVVSKSVIGRFYRIISNGDVLLTVEKDLMGNEWVKNPSELKIKDLKKMLNNKKIAFNSNNNKTKTQRLVGEAF
jgi:hypothetical protein